MKKKAENKDWYKQCRPHLEWVNWQPNLDVEAYANQIISNAKKLNSDTLIYPWESGGLLLYPGKTAPIYENIGNQDLLGTLVKKSHEAGLRFVVCFLGVSANTYMSEKHPDWVQRNADGSLIQKWPGYHFRSMCPNSPYSDYLCDVATEIMELYPIDGIYLEGVYIDEGHCHCEHCNTVFEEQYGRPIPTKDFRRDKEYNAYRVDGMSKPFKAIRRAIDKSDKEVVFFACIGAAYFYNRQGYDAGGVGQIADVVCIEGQWHYDMPAGYDPNFSLRLHEMGLIQRLMKAESGKDVLGTIWISKHVDQNYGQRSEPNIRINYCELMFQGSLVQTHTQNAFEINERRMPVLNELYTGAEKLLPYISDAEQMAYMAILDGGDSTDIENFFDDRFKGIYKIAIENHIPVKIVSPQHISKQLDNRCSVLFVPGVTSVSEETMSCIRAFVQQGGGLVLCGDAIQNPRFAELAGVVYKGKQKYSERFPAHEYFQITHKNGPWKDLAGPVRSYVADRIDMEIQNGTLEIAQVLDIDKTRKSDKHIIDVCYPGHPMGPMVTLRDNTGGKVITIAAEFDRSARSFGDPDVVDTMIAAIKCAGQKPIPLRTSAPETVEVVVHRKSGKLAVLLLNCTTNQYLNAPIRFVVPLKDIVIELDGTFNVNKITTLTGKSVQAEHSGDSLKLTITDLREYEGVLIDLKE